VAASVSEWKTRRGRRVSIDIRLLINFGEVLVKDGIHRIVNRLPD
jgi:hypothetical protein